MREVTTADGGRFSYNVECGVNVAHPPRGYHVSLVVSSSLDGGDHH